jgi:HK97 family phage prohead protease
MRAAARRGIEYYEEGLGGDGLVDRTIREARAMARGSVTAEKWVRISAWIARHLGDLDAPAADPGNEGYPSAGVVAHLLWGSGPSKAAAERTLRYAEGVVARLEEENEGRTKGEALKKMETRTLSVDYEIRETGDGMLFEGYAAVFDSPSEPLPFTERIAPGAFARSLKNRNDVKLMWNHDTGAILGSSRAGTLKLVEDGRGLKVSAELPNTTLGRDTAELLRRGDVDAMSFGFSVPKNGDSWSEDGSERTLKEIRLHEVSIVAFPAYTGTAGTATVRALDRLALRADVDVDALADALLKLENGENMSAADRGVLSNVLDTLAPEDEAEDSTKEETPDLGVDLLALKKKKIELLKGYYNG